MKVLIQGGGIAGLAMAAFLNKVGIFPTVIDQAPKFGDIGFWVYVYDNGRKILRELGVEDQLDADGYRVPGYKIVDEHDKLIHYMDFDALPSEFIAATSIERPNLHSILQKLVDPKSAVRFNTSVTDVQNTDNGVDVIFNNGASERFDLVVAADGMHSYLRSQIFPENHEIGYGMHAWLFASTNPSYIPDEIVHRISAGAYAVLYPHGKERVGVYLAAKVPEGTYSKENDGRDDLAQLFANFGSPIDDLIAGISEKTPMFHDDIQKVQNNDSYRKRVVLIGDAEHAMSPLLGQGSSMALEDAYVLAEELASHKHDIDRALSNYQTRRLEKVQGVQKLSDLLMNLMRISNPAEEQVVRELIRHFAPPSLLLDTVMSRIEKAP